MRLWIFPLSSSKGQNSGYQEDFISTESASTCDAGGGLVIDDYRSKFPTQILRIEGAGAFSWSCLRCERRKGGAQRAKAAKG